MPGTIAWNEPGRGPYAVDIMARSQSHKLRTLWTLRMLWLLLLLAATGMTARAQFVSGVKDGWNDINADDQDPTRLDPKTLRTLSFGDRVNLSTPWLVQSGHNGDFASPVYDDSGWQPVNPVRRLPRNLFRNLNEVWYRVHARLAPGTHDLGLTVADFGGSYRVYVNGREIGGHGVMAGRGDYLLARSATYAVPDAALAADTVIAIHAFVGRVASTSTTDDGFTKQTLVSLGPANVLYRDQSTYFANGLKENISALTLWAVLLALSLALSFFILKAPVYPVLAVFAGAHLFGVLLGDWASFHYYPNTHGLMLLSTLLLLLSKMALLEFLRILAVAKWRWPLLSFAAFYVFAGLSLGLATTGLMSFALYSTLLKISHVLLQIVVMVLIWVGMRRKQQDAFVLGSVLGLYVFYRLAYWALGFTVFYYAPLNTLAQAFRANIVPERMADLAIVASFVGVVLVRTLRIVRERAAIANEIEAARTMQQLLLSQANQTTPGFQVESVYLPAGEVGGDFFLVSPCAVVGEEPSLTVIVGDVSGKGLRAAMRVSMILGVLRREPSREPAAMLHGLNQALAAEGAGSGGGDGFTTACCVRISPDGQFTVANAGHISPYISGIELTTPPALPLGLVPLEAGETYPLLAGRLQPGQRLVLMSDGVAEARSHKGELYGFERLGPLTLRPAQDIATTAQQFGQDDDITVLTIACSPRTTNTAPPPRMAMATPPPPMPGL